MITLAMINTDSNKHGEQVEQLVKHKRARERRRFQMISLVAESENLKLTDVVSYYKEIREMDSGREKEKKGKIGQKRILRMNLERKRFSQSSMQLLYLSQINNLRCFLVVTGH